MNIKTTLKVAILIFFVVTATYLVTVASGYKFDWSQRKFIQTGTIHIRSNPQDVKIYLNGKIKGSRSSLKIKYLLPGEYDLKIESEGYKTWEKRVKVEQSLVTEEREIILFWENANEQTIATMEGLKDAITSESKEELIYWTDDSLYFQKIDSAEKNQILNLTDKKIKSVKASNDFDRILIETELTQPGTSGFLLCQNKDCGEIIDVNQNVGVNFTRIDLLGEAKKDFIAYELEKLNYIDPYSKARNFIDSKVSDAEIFTGRLYYIKKKGKFSTLNRSALNGMEKEEIFKGSEVVDLNEAKVFVDYKRDDLYLALKSGLYILNDDKNGLEKIMDTDSRLDFGNSRLVLIEGSDEIWIRGKFKPTEEEETMHLVARYAEKIEDLTWLKNTNHVLFSMDGSLRAIEKSGSNETDLYTYTTYENDRFFPIKRNKILVLDGNSLKMIEVTKENGLLDWF